MKSYFCSLKMQSGRNARFAYSIYIILLILIPGCGSDRKHNFRGQSIIVIAPKLQGELISGPIIEEAKKFEIETGAKVRVVTPGWNETIEKISASFEAPEPLYDLFVITTSWSGPIFSSKMAEPVPESVKRKIDWDDILPIYRENILSWNQRAFALPYDGDTVTLYYRKDLFENPEYRQEFFKRFGYKLGPPDTWKKYHDIAQFFNGWDWDHNGSAHYGIVESRLVNTSAIMIFLTRAAALAKNPDDPAFYFDPATMEPRIDNPAFVRALQEHIDIMRYGPPGMVNYSGSEVRTAFVMGRAAMSVDWANIGISAVNNPASVVKGKVGYAQLPGSDAYYNSISSRWESHFNRTSSMLGNYIFIVNRKSRNKELAFAFAAHMCSPAITKMLTASALSGVNPSRYSHFHDPASWNAAGFSTDEATRYLDTLQVSLSNPNYIFDIRIPGSDRYYRALDEAVHDALTGKLTAKSALRRAAQEWDRITDSLGREQQKKYYKESLNI